MDNILDMENTLKFKALEDEIDRLTNDITKYQILLKECGMDYEASEISDEEALCVQEIIKLKKYSDDRELSTDEIKKFDLLNKNLRLIRGQVKRGKSSNLNHLSDEELMEQFKNHGK